MAHSFLGLYLTNFLAFLFLLIASVLFIIAPSQIVNANNASQTTISNNQTARSLLYGAGVLGILVVLIILFWIFYIWYAKPVEFETLNKDIIMASYFGFGTFLLVMFLFLLMIGSIVLAALSLTYIDTSTTSGADAKWWVIAGIVLGVIAVIIYFVSFFFYTPYNAYLDTLITPELKMLAQRPIFSVNTDELETREFSGNINIKGQFKQPKEYITYNGKLIEANPGKAGYENIDVNFNVDDKSAAVVEQPVVVEKRTVVKEPVVVERPVLKQTAVAPSRLMRRPVVTTNENF